MGGQGSSCGEYLLFNCIVQGFSSTVAMWGEALLQMWCVGSSLVVSSCTSIFVPWVLLSCSAWVPLVVVWRSSLVVLRSYLIFP